MRADPPLGQVSVLIVDDQPRNRELLGDLMALDGYHTRFASDGLEAIEEVEKHADEIDLIMLDVMMPRLDGFETCRRLRQMDGAWSVPIIMVTALGDRSDRLRGIEAGANDFLTKPLESAEVRLRAKNAIFQKRLTDQVKKDFRRLRDLEQLRDSMVHMVVHDLRSPLTNVKLCLGLLEAASGLSEDDAELVREANVASDRLMQLVNTLLDMSRLESGDFPVHPHPACLVELLKASVEGARRLAGSRTLTLQTPVDQHPVRIDVAMIERIVENLIHNAVKATKSDGRVDVRMSVEDGRTLVEVADDGYGIPPDQHGRVFEKFGRAEQSKTEGPKPGWGLGLAFVKMATEAHGGQVGFESEPGKGSRFWFVLPTAGAAPSAEPSSS